MRSLKVVGLAFGFICGFALLTVQAAGYQSGTVSRIIFTSGDVGGGEDSFVYFFLAGAAATGHPACQMSQTYWVIRDAKSVIGQQQIAVLIAAKTLGRDLTVRGTGACVRWGEGEDVKQIDWDQ